MKVTLEHDLGRLEKSLLALASELNSKAVAVALTRTATAARREVMQQLPDVFDRPTPFTRNAVRYEMARADSLAARVFISDDAAKGLSPRKYLGPEIAGGVRDRKRAESAMQRANLIGVDQWVMPGSGMPLDRFGNVRGSTMVRILSRLSAFGETGYTANASKTTKRRLDRRKLAAKQTRTNFFIARGKWSDRPLGVWQVVGKGVVKPVLAFVGRAPHYRPRFDFDGIVRTVAAKQLPVDLHQQIEGLMRRRLG